MNDLKNLLEKLALETEGPCVSVALRTHRTHPDNAGDAIVLKKALRTAQEEVLAQWGKEKAGALLKKLENLGGSLDTAHNEECLLLFLSNDTEEVVRTGFAPAENRVQVASSFQLQNLVEAYTRSVEYFIAVVEKGGVKVFWAKNDRIISELKNADFPFPETPFFAATPAEASNATHMNNLLREYLNRVDKALVRLYDGSNRTPIVVISTEDNWGHLIDEADKPSIYAGHDALDYNHAEPHTLEKQGWKVMQAAADKERADAVAKVQTATGNADVLTLPADILKAAQEGRAEMLLIEHRLQEVPVEMGEASNDTGNIPASEPQPPAGLAWEVLSKGGKVHFVEMGALGEMGAMALKTRY